jgi:hypothetical protein
MDDLQTSDALTFIPEQIEPAVFEAIESVLKDKIYNEKLVQGWVDEICCKLTKDLVETNKPFKYVGKFLLLKSFSSLIFFHSLLYDHAKEWRWLAHSSCLSLGC